MNQAMHVSYSGLEIIKSYESFSATWYLCPSKEWTIAYGHVRLAIDKFEIVSKAFADILLKGDCLIAEASIKRNVKVELNQNQFDALVSFVFNIGVSQFKSSTLLKLLNTGDYKAASEQFKRWNKADGKVLKGLVTRRSLEAKLFTSVG